MFGLYEEAEKLVSVEITVKGNSVKFETLSVLDGDFLPTKLTLTFSFDDMASVYLPKSMAKTFDKKMSKRHSKGKSVAFRCIDKPEKYIKIGADLFDGMRIPLTGLNYKSNKLLKDAFKSKSSDKDYKRLLKAANVAPKVTP